MPQREKISSEQSGELPMLSETEVHEILNEETEAKSVLLETLRTKGLSPEAALEIVASYNQNACDQSCEADLGSIVKEYGVHLDLLRQEEKQKLAAMYMAALKVSGDKDKIHLAEAMDIAIREELIKAAGAGLDRLSRVVMESSTVEEVKERLVPVMESMRSLGRQLPPDDPGNEKIWMELYDKFKALVEHKQIATDEMEDAFDAVFLEYGDFIEDEFVAREIRQRQERGEPFGLEKVVHSVYGRSMREVEELKEKNRENVAALIMQLKEETTIDATTLRRLYETNNRGVVPKKYAGYRGEDEAVTFGSRMGLWPEDIEPEMELFLKRANEAARTSAFDGKPEYYAVAAANLHNDLVEIHPFRDRNGSTGLLFLELLMAKKGYIPSPEREKDYYKQIGKVLGENPLAISLIGALHKDITETPGFFHGKTITGEKTASYARGLDYLMGRLDEAAQKDAPQAAL